MRPAMDVVGVGMVTPFGIDAEQTLAGLAAGRSPIGASGLVGATGERIVGSFVWPVRPGLEAERRALALVRPALRECVAAAGPGRGPAALFVCAPLPWGSFGSAFAPLLPSAWEDWAVVLDALAEDLAAHGIDVPAALRFVVSRGHAAAGSALRHASALFDVGTATQAVLVGLDTQGDRATLERLCCVGALRSRRSPDGFVAGEAAAAVCLRPSTGRRAPSISAVGVATEHEKPNTARALTAALHEAMVAGDANGRPVDAVVVDLNGERVRAKEWMLSGLRTVWRRGMTPEIVTPAALWGDVGAATLPLLIGLLARLQRAGPSLAVASSRDGLRAAVRVEPVGTV